MTNMQPQYANFNQRGTWYKMEEDLRTKAPKIDSDTLFIVKGGTIDPVGSESNLLGWKKNELLAKPRSQAISQYQSISL